jgi:putative signal transducing protein
MEEPVRVTTVPGEPEAEVLCGLLRANGIKCGYRPTDESDSAFEGFGGEGGEREILVAPGDLEAAKALLDADPASPAGD